MGTADFFERPEPHSLIKSQIVSRYFKAWTDIMLSKTNQQRENQIAYVDLFSGPGRFERGEESTPLLILNQAIASPALCDRLVTVFNDANPAHADRLRHEIAQLPGISKLTNEPQLTNTEVDPDLAAWLGNTRLVPTLFFFDPWGYKGLSLDLIGNAIKSWGCDCIFFFHFDSINRSLDIDSVSGLIDELFGKVRADELRRRVRGLEPELRKATILDELKHALKEVGGQHVLPFEFRSRHSDRPSHYVIFVTKDFLGFSIMRDIMFSLSSDDAEIRSLLYNPRKSPQLQLLVDFGSPHSIAQLKDILLDVCAGMSLTVQAAYEQSTIDTPYRLSNVKIAIKSLELEKESQVSVDPPAALRPTRKGEVTLANHLMVTFPPKKG